MQKSKQTPQNNKAKAIIISKSYGDRTDRVIKIGTIALAAIVGVIVFLSFPQDPVTAIIAFFGTFFVVALTLTPYYLEKVHFNFDNSPFSKIINFKKFSRTIAILFFAGMILRYIYIFLSS